MQNITLGSSNLLEYEARYGVLICLKCKYAIQKSALQSHLLRHKIYRDERQRLLSAIAQLDLLEPQDVSLPLSTSQPIKGLPIMPGYRCTAAGCGNLCASAKRMKRHWSEIHGVNESSSHFPSLARPAKLQTFFRGTKLRYFEVAASPVTAAPGSAPLATTDNQQPGDTDTAMPLSPSPSQYRRVTTPPLKPPAGDHLDLDLETLKYFYHFISVTSLTLPLGEGAQHAANYWQTDVVAQALQQKWLMSGLLAISACHLTMLPGDDMTKKAHCSCMVQFFFTFSYGREETMHCNSGAEDSYIENVAIKAGRHLKCLLRCAIWGLNESLPDQEIIAAITAPFELPLVVTTIGLATSKSATKPDNPGKSNIKQMLAQVEKALSMEASSGSEDYGASSLGNNTTSVLLNRVHALPSRMAEALGKPESAMDVFATLSAITGLIECCGVNFLSDEVGTAWQGMTTWVRKVPEQFHQLLSHHNPAALVVLAHWTALLVNRAEHCGYWFIQGMSKKILQQVVNELSVEDQAVQSLVWGLMT
ncbi:hypothetical protein K431DRAFT_111573 [Polychaeton citri CBS 116435]|uniref:C2H2-type domain-containing protein n=1 Tax=Polychaeton citri CBS 116435 TaxID=1314669 RepID=A0A9P4Q4M5_9PEZI|nr:hypothetical protein K431DRAFT_111573 [Polychaeton citri CBS 116435]